MEGRIEFAGLMPHAPILVPGVGGKTLVRAEATAHAMKIVARHALAAQPDTVVVVSPHSPRRPGAFGLWHMPRLGGSLEQFGSSDDKVDLPLDEDFAEGLELEAERRGLRTWRIAHKFLDHGAVVPLLYLTSAGWNGPTVIVGLSFPGEGGLDELGRAIAATARDLKRRTVVIASGDMSHRLTRTAPAGYDPDAHRFDEVFVSLLREGAYGGIRQLDPALQEKAAEDVVDSTRVALAASGYRTAGHHEMLSYEGPFGVGYGVAILFEPKKHATVRAAAPDTPVEIISRFAELPAVARRAVEGRLQRGPVGPPFCAQGEVAKRRAVFVTVRTDKGKLRGCRGVTTPVQQDLVGETWHNAVAAACFDSRFPAVTIAELPSLRFTVTVLGPLEPVASLAELDPAVYGVQVSAGNGRKGVLLPAIAGVDSVKEQVAIARQKAGIDDDEFVHLERFTTRSFTEPPVGPAGEDQDAG
jgi:AMMECR1 domain-containing protein/aromatic ring-opening dioxygenase LigB subunit